jgi:hypothetical protein
MLRKQRMLSMVRRLQRAGLGGLSMSTKSGVVLAALALCAVAEPAWAERSEAEAARAAKAAFKKGGEGSASQSTVGQSKILGGGKGARVESPNRLSKSRPGPFGENSTSRWYRAIEGGDAVRTGTVTNYQNGARQRVEADGTVVHQTKQGQTTSTQDRDEKGRFLPGQ